MSSLRSFYLRQRLMTATKNYISVSFACGQRTFTIYLLDPEDYYVTYKSGYRCGTSRIFECFSVPFGSSGTLNVRDWFCAVFLKFRVLSSSHVPIADNAESAQRMAPLLESEYKTIFFNKSAGSDTAQVLIRRTNVTCFLHICKVNHTTHVSRRGSLY